MALEFYHVEGKDKGDIKLYALSTCIWCGKTKKLLSDLNVSYDFLDVDLLNFEDQQKAIEQVKRFNPGGGFPTLIINDKDCIVGFDEDKIRQKLS